MYTAKKSAARNTLESFLPKAGREYATGRNYDLGPEDEATVSKLSPWIRTRLLPEWEVLNAVLEQHSRSSASKFIDEVCWRTYWKGWLQLRPRVWNNYLEQRSALLNEYANNSSYLEAIEGRTGIDCFDAWAHELIETNYLHNHSHMWCASIWIHTLQLPWELGADWFLSHLIDGDPASNTLSWRWVAGLHTAGKTYLARPDNIRKYTNGRFAVNAPLANHPIELESDEVPPPQKLEPSQPIPSSQRLGLLITDEDCSADDWLGPETEFQTKAGFFPEAEYEQLNISDKVTQFRREAITGLDVALLTDPQAVINWAKQNHLDGIVVADPPVGPTESAIRKLETPLEEAGCPLYRIRHPWDQTLFPHATHGFFRFKKAIPKALDQLDQQMTLNIR